MSVEIVPPQFSPERIGLALAAAQADSDEFRHVQLQAMTKYDHSLYAFFTEKVIAFGGRRESNLSTLWVAGYVVGYSVLRSAVAEEKSLPIRGRAALHSFALFIYNEPTEPDRGIAEDYNAHPNILTSIKALEGFNEGNTDGARFILGAYGHWANPTRAAHVLPDVPESDLPNGLKPPRQRPVYAFSRYGSR